MAIDQVRGAAANAEFFYGVDGCLFYLRMVGKTKIVVAAEADDAFIVNYNFGLLRAFDYAARPVTMLSLSFIEFLAEVFQVKTGNFSRSMLIVYLLFLLPV